MEATECTIRTDWTDVGKEDLLSHTEESRAQIRNEIERLTWHDFEPPMELPFMQGEGIRNAIRNLRIPKVSRIAWDGCVFGSFGLYGITGHYKNADVDVYIIDSGDHITPVCIDVTEKD